jgi:Ca2+-binding RTX toxin-like protein
MTGGDGSDSYYVDNTLDKVNETASSGGTDQVYSALSAYTLATSVENGIIQTTTGASLNGNSLNNTLSGGVGNDTLNGDLGNDFLRSGAGNDILNGGVGADTMTGSNGSDTFDFNSLSEMGLTSSTWDIITDFVHGQDKIDLSTIDAKSLTTTVNDKFTFIASADFSATDASGQLRYLYDAVTGSGGILYGSNDADAEAEFAIVLTGVSNLTSTDLVL